MLRSSILRCFASLFLLALLLPNVEGRSESPQCRFSGYKPGGNLPGITAISAVPPAKFETKVLDDVLNYFNQGGTVSAATITVIDAAQVSMKGSPQVAAALAVMAVAIGFSQSNPSPQDILDRAQKSVELLAEEVNIRVNQMKDYADIKDLDLEKRLMQRNYKELFDKWVGCVKLPPGEDPNECQKDKESDISSARAHFQNLHSLFSIFEQDGTKYDPHRSKRSADWQWIAKNNGKTYWAPTHDQVKQLEIGLIPFRDYATLHLVALEAIVNTYKDDKKQHGCETYKHYLDILIEKSDFYARYVRWAFEWIFARQQRENYKLSGGGYPATEKCSKSQCTVECNQMVKDNVCTIKESREWVLLGRPSVLCTDYLNRLGGEVVRFWTENLLNVAEKWKKYGEDAKTKRARIQC